LVPARELRMFSCMIHHLSASDGLKPSPDKNHQGIKICAVKYSLRISIRYLTEGANFYGSLRRQRRRLPWRVLALSTSVYSIPKGYLVNSMSLANPPETPLRLRPAHRRKSTQGVCGRMIREANSLAKCQQEKRRVKGGNFFLPGQAGRRAGEPSAGHRPPSRVAWGAVAGDP
jgi:hypothetical protein